MQFLSQLTSHSFLALALNFKLATWSDIIAERNLKTSGDSQVWSIRTWTTISIFALTWALQDFDSTVQAS